ncbi:MAG TPA: hypothetical protein PLV42_10555 [bacterium]|nr:hypothetical protein [bacterium]
MIFRTIIATLVFLFTMMASGAPTGPAVPAPKAVPGPAPAADEPAVPADFDAQLKGKGLNWFQTRVNQSIARAVRERKVALESLNEYLFLMTVPNFAYRGDAGEEKLGEDMMGLLGTIKTGEEAVIMELQWAELVGMGLPFKKKLTDALVFPASYFKNEIDMTFFVDVNTFTARLGAALGVNPKAKAVYNSQQKFYRLKRDDLQVIYIVNIPNIAYEMVYTGEPFENVIKQYLKEAEFLFALMEKYEKKLTADKALTYDGRYIKGKEIFIDLWFLYGKVKGDRAAAESFIAAALQHKPVTVSGSEKGGGQ